MADQHSSSRFDKEPLIAAIVSEQMTWHITSDCLWSTAAAITGKTNLASLYRGAELEKFFTSFMQIPKLSIGMVYYELLHLSPQNGAQGVEEVKILLRTLNDLLRSDEQLDDDQGPKALFRKSILPVKSPNGYVALRSKMTAFAIVDRKYLGEIFGSRVNVLDFEMGEICTLKPLLEWAGLEDRHMSRMVTEVPDLGSGAQFPISDYRFDIKRKAHCLLRCVPH